MLIYVFGMEISTIMYSSISMLLISNRICLTILKYNPYEFDKKRFKKEPNYLKQLKKNLFIFIYSQSKVRGDDINTTFIIRDWKNKQIYNATHINTGLNEILAPLIDY